VSDLEREIHKRLVAPAGHPLRLLRPDAIRAISAVLDIHKPIEQYPFNPSGHCGECNDSGWEGALDGASPVAWPCRTVKAIAGALGVREEGE
jgi:hypothetical protein